MKEPFAHDGRESAKPATNRNGQDNLPVKPTPDTYWLLEGVTLLLFNLLGGLYVQGEENVPKSGPVLLVSNHISYLDPCAIGDASPRRVVFMAKAELFQNRFLRFLLRGVDSFPVRRGEADRSAFKNTLAMLEEGRVVAIFPQGTRRDPNDLSNPEPGAALFAIRTGCPVVPVYVSGTEKMLPPTQSQRGPGKFRRAKVVVAFGQPFTLPKNTPRDEGGQRLMEAIMATRDQFAHEVRVRNKLGRRIWPHWINKPLEGSRARKPESR